MSEPTNQIRWAGDYDSDPRVLLERLSRHLEVGPNMSLGQAKAAMRDGKAVINEVLISLKSGSV
jgi:hypothetical protein